MGCGRSGPLPADLTIVKRDGAWEGEPGPRLRVDMRT